ncbi:MAG: hypothetical protein MJK12_01260 [Colwellia sp.]|nr:hypothetical protein [Colwellia sp.]
MAHKTVNFFLYSFIIFSSIACSSRHNGEEVACNFASGASTLEYDDDSSFGENLLIDVLAGAVNMLWQGAHRSVSNDSYDTCVKQDKSYCIDSNGDVKEECILTE